MDTAVGPQLDILAKYIGVERGVLTTINADYFGFRDDNPAATQNDNGFQDDGSGNGPIILAQPVGGSILGGASFTLSIAAADASSYQWYLGATLIVGAISPAYTIASASSGDAGSYTCLLTNANGTLTSDAAVLVVISGITSWTAGSTPIGMSPTSIAYGGGVWVAVGAISPYIWRSTDGINFSSVGGAPGSFWQKVIYGNGIFVAFQNGHAVATSPDGSTWTVYTLTTGLNCSPGGIWDGTQFVAMFSLSSNWYIYTSPDGAAWTQGALLCPTSIGSTAGTPTQIIFTGSLYVITFQTANVNVSIRTSPDLITWTAQSSPAGYWYGLAYGNGVFVAISIGLSSPYIMTSPNGIAWTAQTNTASAKNWKAIVFTGSIFVISGALTQAETAWSVDGVNWTLVNAAVDYNNWQAIAVGSGLAVAVAGVSGTTSAMHASL